MEVYVLVGINPGIHQIAIRGQFIGQAWQVSQYYDFANIFGTTITASEAGEAYWDNVSGPIRALFVTTPNLTVNSIFIRELAAGGEYGEYAIPIAEQQGVRSAEGMGEFLPSFAAFGFRLAVATRTTRPGQKRFPGVMEGDNSSGVLSQAARDLVAAVAVKFVETLTMNPPAAFVTMQPRIVRLNPSTGTVVASQPVAGALVNPNVTTQNTRKMGRGA